VDQPSSLPSDPAAPDFHQSDKKLEPLSPDTLSDDDYSSRCAKFLHELDRSLAGKRVLDVGCGRGELVMRLRRSGVQAFGLEVEPEYVHSGRILNELYSDEFPTIGLAKPGGIFPYPDDYFDWVVSFQVLEHVENIQPLASEIARVLREGAATVHVLPAKYRFLEPHYALPFVHWLPKSAVRESAISMFLRLGFQRRMLQGHDHKARVRSIYQYANSETFYRDPSEIARCFEKAGLTVERRRATTAFLKSRLPDLPVPERVVGPAMNWLWTTIICARKTSPPKRG
jgi:SAM-dependent methyltransferase